jgi:hypothetical protein
MNPHRTLFLLMLVAGFAHADTLYRCTDAAGVITYTNQKDKGSGKQCTVMAQDKPVTTFSAPKARPSTPTPEGFPRVNSETQKDRDGDRRRILEEELQTEQEKLDEAKKKLADQEAIRTGNEKNYQRVLDRLQPYQEEVQTHEQNVEALQREIGNLR